MAKTPWQNTFFVCLRSLTQSLRAPVNSSSSSSSNSVSMQNHLNIRTTEGNVLDLTYIGLHFQSNAQWLGSKAYWISETYSYIKMKQDQTTTLTSTFWEALLNWDGLSWRYKVVVYKGRPLDHLVFMLTISGSSQFLDSDSIRRLQGFNWDVQDTVPVSYTHLTLPTKA